MSTAARCRKRGFTLVEWLVVMVIIGLLSGHVAPHLFGQIAKAEARPPGPWAIP